MKFAPPVTALPLVVGTIHSAEDIQHALKLAPEEVDLLELRVDAFAQQPEPLLEAAALLRQRGASLLATVRHPSEGGAGRLHVASRRRLVRQFLPWVQWVDFEFRSLEAMEEEIADARSQGVRVIASDHHFNGVPALAVLQRRFGFAREWRPEVFKIAATAHTALDMAQLLNFFNWGNAREPGRLAVMGMGPFGKVSRLLLGRSGSVFNYGYLSRPQVPGQWQAQLLKKRLMEVLEA